MIADYFNRVNPDLLAFIPPDAKVILEIGCGAGALAEAYRRVNPNVEWHGVEVDPEAAQLARLNGVEVYEECAERIIFADLDILDPPDVLVLGDILEHLRSPWAVLSEFVAALAPGAQVLASIPNIQHFSVLYNLLFGHFKYADEGVMDRDHLRWFTLEGIREMFDQAGLEIFEARGIRSPADGEGWKLWSEFIAPLNIDLRQTAPLQYLVRAIKPILKRDVVVKDTQEGKPRTHGMAIDVTVTEKTLPIHPIHIHAVTAEPCCARPRIHEPFQALGTIPGVKCTTSLYPDSFGDRHGPDVIIQQRFREMNLKAQADLIDNRSLIIAELDDDPAGLQGYPENDYIQLRAVHAIQVSTERLAETVREYNPNVMVFENQIADLPPFETPRKAPHTALFYGAQNRQEDWAPIMPALNRILADHPKDIEVYVVCDQEFFDALETTEKTFRPFLPYNDYRNLLGGCDIALLPLEPTRFNEHKSDIKFLECAAEGVAVLASETVYSDPITTERQFHSVDERGFLWDSPERFERLLRRLIESPEDRLDRAQKAYAYVRDHRMLGQHFRKRLEAYQALLQSKADLDRQLFERCPALRPVQPVLSESHP